jgi:hypothetical protein
VVLTWLTARLASCQARREPECFAPRSGWNDGARLFALTLFVYPLALALLCLGAGLLVDRCSGRFLPAALLPSVGAAALIALSQLSTYVSPLAPATPYLMVALALLGFALSLGSARDSARGGDSAARVLLLRLRGGGSALAVAPLVYLLALAPVLLSGRAGFSSFMALSDSAVHMIGADYLIHHGQDYTHLDPRSSYGQFIDSYYATGYPSGADTLFGGSALLLRLPLIWAFQPFNGFVLALAAGPAWLLARATGLRGTWAALAALSASVAALVYGYELIGSIKELTAAVMLLTLGALVVAHPRWLVRRPRCALPCALVLAAGVSALGVGFGAWGLAVAAVLLVALIGALRDGRCRPRDALLTVLAGALALLVAAWPTWTHISASLNVAQNIATTANPGNLQAPLKWTQAFGIWLNGSYKELPSGAALGATDALIGLAFAACLLGALQLLRRRRSALAGWIALTLLAWLVLDRTATTWVDAKALVLSSPLVVLLAWAGVAAPLEGRQREPARGAALLDGARKGTARGARPSSWATTIAAALLALALAGGALASDAAQYHSSNLAPTARYEELRSLNKRFAGRGPTLFTDFDEYSMYALRDLDVSGPDFVYPPRAHGLARGYGQPVELDRDPPAALVGYALIIARRDPSAPALPAAYKLAWQGAYYEVWARRSGAAPALARVAADSARAPLSCARVVRTVRLAETRHARAIAALAPPLVRIRLRHIRTPKGWGRQHGGFTMRKPGTVSLPFSVSHAGSWQLWLQGQFMPLIHVRLDGHPLASLEGQLAGNSLVPDTATPIAVRLSAGEHRLSVTRSGFSLAPGNGGSAVLDAAFLTPAHAPARVLRTLPIRASGAALCASAYQWIELVRR